MFAKRVYGRQMNRTNLTGRYYHVAAVIMNVHISRKSPRGLVEYWGDFLDPSELIGRHIWDNHPADHLSLSNSINPQPNRFASKRPALLKRLLGFRRSRQPRCATSFSCQHGIHVIFGSRTVAPAPPKTQSQKQARSSTTKKTNVC